MTTHREHLSATKGKHAPPQRPELALRVGVTGARSLRADQVARIDSQLADVLKLVKWEMQSFRQHTTVCDFYSPCGSDGTLPRLCLLSPLAKGADRHAARSALAVGYDLCVPMPFEVEEYEKDFTGSDGANADEEQLTAEEDLTEFRHLLGRSKRQLCLDGARKDPVTGFDLEGRSYEAVGRFVVRNCDLLVAVWDGAPAKGRGGSADVVRFAATVGVPVWWISATQDVAPKWIADIQDLRDPVTEKITAEEKLQKYLGRLVLPPEHVKRHMHGWIGRLAAIRLQKDCSPATTYFKEVPRGRGFPWWAHRWVMDMAAREGNPKNTHRRADESADELIPRGEPMPAIVRYWHERYLPVDGLAGDYAARYRSTYVLVILFTTLALIFGAIASTLKLELAALIVAGCELISLLVILVLVGASLRLEWHERSIEYRLLAELFRKQQVLAPLGWALSVGNVQHLADTGRLTWVAWLFAAEERAAPLPDSAKPLHDDGFTLLTRLIEEQISYHRDRKDRSERAAKRFEFFGSLVNLAWL